jgi:hypothetical protein
MPSTSGPYTNRHRFLGLASSSHCVLQAVLAFGAAILAWETNAEDIRHLSTGYSANAHGALQEASSNQDALFAALTLLSWVETTWDRWSRLDKTSAKVRFPTTFPFVSNKV